MNIFMQWLNIVQIILSVLLMASILLQKRGSGLGAAFGGDGALFRSKRGLEKKLFYATILLALLLLASAFLQLIPTA